MTGTFLMAETEAREKICVIGLGRSLLERGYAHATAVLISTQT